MRVYLQDMVEDISFDSLPVSWQNFDLKTFSDKKNLWDYQQEALENAIRVLWKYYEDISDFKAGEGLKVNDKRKEELFKWYKDNGLEDDLDISLPEGKKMGNLLQDYYPVLNGKIPYKHFINRMGFWMATGSGKTLVIIKLIEILRELILRKEIPKNDILVLTCRDDLIEQFKRHVEEFNSARSDFSILLKELKEYEEVKRYRRSLFQGSEITVFYYRSDNISDEQKERIIDFRNYENDGRWYVFLDEAHKGDKEESKRQHIYSILSRNGFLFNFSATFTDPRDIATTVFNFNLSEFIKEGYGKHIYISKQEFRAFKDKEDYSGEEKRKIVLKSLLMLTYALKMYEKVKEADPQLYHRPLMLTLVHSVNTKDADLKLFFRELEKIGRGEVESNVFEDAKKELLEELRQEPSFIYEEDEKFEVYEDELKNLKLSDVLKHVYNAESAGETEVLTRPSNRQEMAFKLKTSSRPFALIKIGDISEWLKELSGYEIIEGFEDESFFERINEDDSDITVLMGSRSFYEGWDSNRPNVINFINIGKSSDAVKFILQAVGRGVRIEPLKNKRKRLLELYNAKEVSKELFDKVKDKVLALETLVVFATSRRVLLSVIEGLSNESKKRNYRKLSLQKNPASDKFELLIPVYRLSDEPVWKRLMEDGNRIRHARFEIDPEERHLIKAYLDYVEDPRVLMAIHNARPRQIRLLKESLNNSQDKFFKEGKKAYRNLNLLVQEILTYFDVFPQEFEGLKKLEDEIKHFKNVQVYLKNIEKDIEDVEKLERVIDQVRQFEDPELLEKQLDEKFERGEINREEYKEGIKRAASMKKEEEVELSGKRLKIRYVANHYYIPVILSDEKERINYIKHIIQVPSEIEFLNKLEEYLKSPDNRFKNFDWWMFSKIDESLDEVYIPWYNGKKNAFAKFKPDFIFWLRKGKDYFIVFVDPKGKEHTEYQLKVDSYSALFEDDEGKKRVFDHRGMRVRVFLFLYTSDIDSLPERYRSYWFESVDGMLEEISLV